VVTGPAKAFPDAGGVEGWHVLGEGAGASFRAPSLLTAAQFVQAVAALADDFGEAPEIDLRADGVTVRLPDRTHVELARQVSALARELDLPADPSLLG
jgi:4a-hydroxytetrahydrobiopterin dehydratase